MGEIANLTERQQAWFASIRDGLHRDTGKTLEEWTSIARTCPETKWRAQLKWMKDNHGLGQNRASMVLHEAFPKEGGWNAPDDLLATLWKDDAARAIFEAAKAGILALPDVLTGQRKTYTAFSRAFQFAAMRPVKSAVLIGLAVRPDAAPGLAAPRRAIWSERLKSEMLIEREADIAPLAPLIRQAWDAS